MFLAPADARAAFERGAVEAWAIWDLSLAAAQAATGARTLTTGEGIVPNVQFYIASRSFAAQDGNAIDAPIAALQATDRWAADNRAPCVVARIAPV